MWSLLAQSVSGMQYVLNIQRLLVRCLHTVGVIGGLAAQYPACSGCDRRPGSSVPCTQWDLVCSNCWPSV